MTNITLAPVQPDQPSHLMATYGHKRSALYEDEGRIYIRQMVRNI